MNYIKVRMDFAYCEKGRFFRTFLVNPDLSLVDFGCAIVTAFNGTFEHCFCFKNEDKVFNPRAFMEEMVFENDVLMDNYTVQDLTANFEFTYDTGDGWDFKGAAEDTNEKVKYKDIVLIDGAGLGIWEDNIHTLHAYFDGKINPNSKEVNEDKGYYPPWNMKISKYGDFDTAFDLEKQINRFNRNYRKDIFRYKTGEREYFGLIDSFDYNKNYFDKKTYDQIMNDVEEMIELDQTINAFYEELISNHKPREAMELIAKEYIFEMLLDAKNNKDFRVDRFYKAVKDLL